MKIILISDEYTYREIRNLYALEKDKNGEVIASEFDRNSYNIIHMTESKYINMVVNDLCGIHNVTHLILQKRLFKNPQLLKILRRLKIVNPTVKTILYLDDDYVYYEVLLSRIAKEHLADVILDIGDIDMSFDINYQQDLSGYILKKETKKLLKEFKQY